MPIVIYGTTGRDIIPGTNAADEIWGRAGNDILAGGAGNDWLIGGAGSDSLSGGAGIDGVSYAQSKAGVNVTLGGSASGGDATGDILFDDIEKLTGSANNDRLTGNAQNNSIYAGDGNDLVSGADGDDRVFGDAGTDTVLGGSGNDSVVGDSGNDKVYGEDGNDWLDGGPGSDFISGGAGNDTVSYYDNASIGVSVDLTNGIGGAGDAQGDRYESVESVDGTNYSDVLIGDSAANTLRGGSDIDILRGGAGADVLDGGAGFDMSSYADSTSGVTVNLGTGKATGGTATGDILVSIEAITGSAYADAIAGSIVTDFLDGGAGNDALRGSGGGDWLTGGSGADRFVVGAVRESIPGSADWITDFSHTQGDRIDVSQIDANGNGIAGTGAFTFIGIDAYTGMAGQLRYVLSGSYILIAGDVDGDKVSDLNIKLSNVGSIQASDFML